MPRDKLPKKVLKDILDREPVFLAVVGTMDGVEKILIPWIAQSLGKEIPKEVLFNILKGGTGIVLSLASGALLV